MTGVPQASDSAATEQNVSRRVEEMTTNAQRRIASATACGSVPVSTRTASSSPSEEMSCRTSRRSLL